MRFPVVLFDLDGTVIDSGAIILASMRHAAREVLGVEVPDEQLMAAVGGPGSRHRCRPFRPTVRTSSSRFIGRTTSRCTTSSSVAPGWTRSLVQLKDEGRRLGIVTAKRRQTVELAFARIPIEHLFETVVGGDETKKHKPDPEPLLLALERLGAGPGDAVYVGDAPFDVKAAKAAGLYSVGVSWGGIHRRERLEAEEPDALVDTTEELLGVL